MRWLRIFPALILVSACTSTARAPVTSANTGSQSGPAPVTGARATQERQVVAAGDTLYSIAWRYDMDYRDIARWNGIHSPYLIYPGQVLRLTPPAGQKAAQSSSTAPARSAVTQRAPAPPPAAPAAPPQSSPPVPRSNVPIDWRWPTQGTIVQSDSLMAKKGINIGGQAGQAVVAAASGSVVYSGSGLLGYGRLIIIKHNDSYLSAYAHNQKILVHEGEQVTAGQQIATMGLGSDGRPVLHFEIRKDGVPVDPLEQLPKRSS